MSTKIYSGFKFNTSDLGDVQAYVNNWRSRIGAIALEKANKRISERVVTAIDRADVQSALTPGAHIEIADETDGPLYLIAKEMRDEALKDAKEGYRNVEMDFDFEVDLIYHQKAFYGVIRTGQSDWRKAWVSSEKAITDYSYWDNTDRPDNVSEADWDERRVTWDALLKDAKWRPAYAGFTCVIHSSMDTLYKMGKPDEIVHHQPAFEERLERAVEAAFMDIHIVPPKGPDFHISRFLEARSRVNKMFKSEEYADEVAALRERFKNILRPRIEKSDLRSPYEPNDSPEAEAQAPYGP